MWGSVEVISSTGDCKILCTSHGGPKLCQLTGVQIPDIASWHHERTVNIQGCNVGQLLDSYSMRTSIK